MKVWFHCVISKQFPYSYTTYGNQYHKAMFYNFYHKKYNINVQMVTHVNKKTKWCYFRGIPSVGVRTVFFLWKNEKKVHFTVQDKNVETVNAVRVWINMPDVTGAWNLYVDKTHIAIMLSHNLQIELKLVSVSFLKGKTYPKTWRGTPPTPQIFKILIRRGLGGGDN